MKKTHDNLVLLNVIFCISLVVANVVTSKIVDTGIPWFNNSHIMIPGAALIYAVTFLMTDVIGEIWGKKEANKAVKRGFFAQIFASLFILLTQYLPCPDPVKVAAYENILGMNWMFAVGSLVAYTLSQSWDVWIFHKIRNKFNGNPNKRWIWNNASTMTSQIIDTVVFIGIAFGLGMGWFFDNRTALYGMFLGQYLIKFVIAAFDTPFFYLMTRKCGSEWQDEWKETIKDVDDDEWRSRVDNTSWGEWKEDKMNHQQ